MRMDIDKARAHGQSLGVDGVAVRQLLFGIDEEAPVDEEFAPAGWGSGSVDDIRVDDADCVHMDKKVLPVWLVKSNDVTILNNNSVKLFLKKFRGK